MRLKGVSFKNWLASHSHKDPKERWLRELYPWPVLALVDYDRRNIGVVQRIRFDGVEYEVTLQKRSWQPNHQTFRNRIFVECAGLGWHARSLADEYDVCGAPDGSFVTVFHAKRKEPLERIARSFFGRRWGELQQHCFKSLAVSRFLAASIASGVAEDAYSGVDVSHYPTSTLVGGTSPMLASGQRLWIGYRFFSEQAFEWARCNAANASQVVACYFADTKYQFKTDLPPNAIVRSISEVDAVDLNGEYHDLILALLRRLELPDESLPFSDLEAIVRGQLRVADCPVTDADVDEAHAALKTPYCSKAALRYQLAAGVVLNAWIESERELGFVQRKRFYAFKQRIGDLVHWAMEEPSPGVDVWAEPSPTASGHIVYIRVDNVDFSFHAIPHVKNSGVEDRPILAWSGVRLKPIAPLVLRWAGELLKVENDTCDAR